MVLISCAEGETGVELNDEGHLTTKSGCVIDSIRNREIPITIYNHTVNSNSELIILNAGYGCSSTEYSYLGWHLANEGYLVISVQHEVESDPMLPGGENIYDLRLPFWEEGIQNVFEVMAFAGVNYPEIDNERIHLIGHSNGGDIAMLFATNHSSQVRSCITLDHRRVPIPRTGNIPLMSIRGSDFDPDPGVLPTIEEQTDLGIQIVQLENVGHNYLRDNGTKETKDTIAGLITDFLSRYAK